MIVITCVLAAGMMVVPIQAKNLFLGVDVGYFSHSSSEVREMYDSGGVTFGVNGAYRIFNMVYLQAAFDFYSTDGKVTISGEVLKLNQKMLRLGGCYRFDLGKFKPGIGAGLSMNWVKEENPFAPFDESKLGWYAGAGFDISVFGPVLVGFELVYNDVSMTGDLGPVSLAGLSALFSLKAEI